MSWRLREQIAQLPTRIEDRWIALIAAVGALSAIVAVALLLEGEEGLASGRSQADAGKRNFFFGGVIYFTLVSTLAGARSHW